VLLAKRVQISFKYMSRDQFIIFLSQVCFLCWLFYNKTKFIISVYQITIKQHAATQILLTYYLILGFLVLPDRQHFDEDAPLPTRLAEYQVRWLIAVLWARWICILLAPSCLFSMPVLLLRAIHGTLIRCLVLVKNVIIKKVRRLDDGQVDDGQFEFHELIDLNAIQILSVCSSRRWDCGHTVWPIEKILPCSRFRIIISVWSILVIPNLEMNGEYYLHNPKRQSSDWHICWYFCLMCYGYLCNYRMCALFCHSVF